MSTVREQQITYTHC